MTDAETCLQAGCTGSEWDVRYTAIHCQMDVRYTRRRRWGIGGVTTFCGRDYIAVAYYMQQWIT